jgi:hypothetical protein
MWHYYAHIQVGEAILKWNGIDANMNMPLLLGNAVRKGKASQREPKHSVQTSQSPHRNQMLVTDRKQNSSKPPKGCLCWQMVWSVNGLMNHPILKVATNMGILQTHKRGRGSINVEQTS